MKKERLKRIARRITAFAAAAAMAATFTFPTEIGEGFFDGFGNAIVASAETATGDFTVTGGELVTDYTYADGVLTIKSEKALTIANTNPNTPTTDRIEVADGCWANITLAGVNIDVSSLPNIAAFKHNSVNNNLVVITLAQYSVNKLKSGSNCAGLQTKNNQLRIKGEGELIATGGDNGAGIGGGYHGSASLITITGGTVIATGSGEGAGIGGGYEGKGSDIYISGGTVTATGSGGGAGIGGGKTNSGSNITITGGTVTATGGLNGGAGIGGGYQAAGSSIHIKGGTVTATGSGGGAGIGGGYNYSGSNITISGGSVKVAAGENANAIGGGLGHGAVTPTNDTNNVYLLTIANPDSAEVVIDGKAYTPVNHKAADSSDTNLYVYLPAKTANDPNEVTVGTKTTKYIYDTTNAKWLELTDVPAADTTIFTYTGSEQTYNIAESEYYTVSGNKQTDAGTYTVTVYLKDKVNTVWNNGSKDDIKFDFVIHKAVPPTVTEPTATAITYGQALSASTLSDANWSWVDGSAIPTVENSGYDAKMTVDDSNYDYTDVEGYDSTKHTVTRTIAVTVNKATPNVTAPTATAITYGQTLSASTLSDANWSWVDGTVIPTVENSGYAAKITVDDSNSNYDYSGVEGYDSTNHTVTRTIAVTVNKATPTDATTASQSFTKGTASTAFAAPVFKGIDGKELTGSVSYTYGGQTYTTTAALTAVLDSLDGGASGTISYTFTPTSANYTTASGSITFSVIDAVVTGITLKSAPTKTTYEVGEPIDITGGKITVSYNNGTSADIDITAEMISGFDSTTAGEKTVTVTYSGFTATFKVTVSKGTFTVEPTPGNMEGAKIDMTEEELYNAVLTPEDKALIEQGVDIAVLMTVITINPSSVPANDVTAIANVMGDFELGCYIDVSLFKKYSNSNTEVPVTDTNSPITISFKVPADILAQYPVSEYEYSVFCSHNGVGYPITCTYNAATNVMSFSSTMFSTYALAVKSRTPAAVDYTITADSHVTVQSTAQAGDIVSVTVEDGYKATVTNSLGTVITTITGTGSFVMPESNVTITSELINTHVHYYSTEWKMDSTSHWYECECGDRVNVAAHVSNGGIVTVRPTETTEGVRTYSCSICGYVMRTETIPTLDPDHSHSYDTQWKSDSTSHWHECDCGEKVDISNHISDGGVVTVTPTETGTGIMTYSCSICGYILRTETIPENTPVHTHNYGTAWYYDSTCHWHECSCGDRSNIGQHISNGGIVTVQPTATSTGLRVYSCSVCGYVLRTETIPATGYNYPNYPTYPTYPTYPFDSSIFNVVTFTDKVNVTAETEGNTITIKWDKVEKADKYYVYQYKNGKYVKVKTTSDTSATFKKLKNGETYKFLIRYTKSGRLSPTKYSGTISVKVYYKPIPKPTATKNSIKLTWEAIPEAEKYAVYKYVDGKAIKLTETKKLSVKIGKLIPDTEYKYIVRAYVDGKWTTMTKSDIVTVKTTAE